MHGTHTELPRLPPKQVGYSHQRGTDAYMGLVKPCQRLEKPSVSSSGELTQRFTCRWKWFEDHSCLPGVCVVDLSALRVSSFRGAVVLRSITVVYLKNTGAPGWSPSRRPIYIAISSSLEYFGTLMDYLRLSRNYARTFPEWG